MWLYGLFGTGVVIYLAIGIPTCLLLFRRDKSTASYRRLWLVTVVTTGAVCATLCGYFLWYPYYSEVPHVTRNPGGPEATIFQIIAGLVVLYAVAPASFLATLLLGLVPPRSFSARKQSVLAATVVGAVLIALGLMRLKHQAYMADWRQEHERSLRETEDYYEQMKKSHDHASSTKLVAVEPPRPNFVFILADDLGYGDLGCYGQQQIVTPNLDRMAAEGLRFTQHYAGSTVCAPSRCVLMTGKHLGHSAIRGNRDVSPTSNQPLPAEEVTIAELLHERGYATAVIGKWGLGNQRTAGHPNRQGFDYSYGYLNQSHAHNYYPDHLFRNGAKVPLRNIVPDVRPSGAGVASVRKDYAPDLCEREALAWIEEHHGRPFFLYLPLTLPHANNEAGNRGQETPDYGPYADRDWPEAQKGTAAMITRLDATVGRVRDLLTRLGIADHSLVVFASDNGPHAEGGNDPAFFRSSGALRGIKRDLYEGGIRVPALAVWPDRIAAGVKCDLVSGFQDWLPTLADLAGAPTPQNIDGISLAPTLTGQGEQAVHEFLYWEFDEGEGRRAIRCGDWKGVQRGMNESPLPVELYDLASDPAEQHDLAAARPDVASELESLMDAAHVDAEGVASGVKK